MLLRHFETNPGGYVPRLSGEVYVEAARSLVITCADVAVLNHQGYLFLGQRRADYVLPEWWIVGGRMLAGETFGQAAVRNVKRELGIEVGEDRFTPLDQVLSYALPGRHTVSIVMVLRLTRDEWMWLQPNDEYRQARWVVPQDVANDSSYPPASRQLAADLAPFL